MKGGNTNSRALVSPLLLLPPILHRFSRPGDKPRKLRRMVSETLSSSSSFHNRFTRPSHRLAPDRGSILLPTSSKSLSKPTARRPCSLTGRERREKPPCRRRKPLRDRSNGGLDQHERERKGTNEQREDYSTKMKSCKEYLPDRARAAPWLAWRKSVDQGEVR